MTPLEGEVRRIAAMAKQQKNLTRPALVYAQA